MSSPLTLKNLWNFSLAFLYGIDSASSTQASASLALSMATRLSTLTRTYSVTSCTDSKSARVGMSPCSSQCQSDRASCNGRTWR